MRVDANGLQAVMIGLIGVLALPWCALAQTSWGVSVAAFHHDPTRHQATHKETALAMFDDESVVDSASPISHNAPGHVPLGVRRSRWPMRAGAVVSSGSDGRRRMSMIVYDRQASRLDHSRHAKQHADRWSATVEAWPPDLNPRIHGGMILPFVRSFETQADALEAGTRPS